MTKLYEGEPPPETPPELKKIAFPSDVITIKQLRHQQEHLWYSPKAMCDGHLMPNNVNAVEMVQREIELAHKAFAKALGQPDPYAYITRSNLIYGLTPFYKELGLARGRAETTLLVEQFENEASKLALELLAAQGKKPGKSR